MSIDVIAFKEFRGLLVTVISHPKSPPMKSFRTF
jgi:hypothetical protein